MFVVSLSKFRFWSRSIVSCNSMLFTCVCIGHFEIVIGLRVTYSTYLGLVCQLMLQEKFVYAGWFAVIDS